MLPFKIAIASGSYTGKLAQVRNYCPCVLRNHRKVYYRNSVLSNNGIQLLFYNDSFLTILKLVDNQYYCA